MGERRKISGLDTGGAEPPPLLGWRGVVPALVAGVLLCWPMWLTGADFVFYDTRNYFLAGREIWTILGRAAGWGADAVAAAPEGTGGGAARFGRSLVYSGLAYPLLALGGAAALAVFQGALVVFSVFALIDRTTLAAPRILLAGGLAVAVFCTLPWHVVYLMPDVLGAVLVVFGMALTGPFGTMTGRQKALLTALAILAAGSHYGNMPLAAGIVVVALAVAAATRRLRPATLLAAALVVVVPPAINTVSSAATLEEATPTPLRLPILLARSLADGPARLYLEETCPAGADYAICTAFDGRIPGTIDELLWDEAGVQSLDRATMARIRAEEYGLLLDVLRAYPAAQSWSLARNALRQLTLAGTGQLLAVTDVGTAIARGVPETRDAGGARLQDIFDRITPVATALAALALLALVAAGRVPPGRGGAVFVLAAALAGNALIFGGLSAPVDRYQSRLVWLVPVLLVVILADTAARKRARRG